MAYKITEERRALARQLKEQHPEIADKSDYEVARIFQPGKDESKYLSSVSKKFDEENEKDGTNADYLSYTLEIARMPKIDIYDVNQVQDRVAWYFDHCVENNKKPTVAGFGLALGVSRSMIHQTLTGKNKLSKNSDVVDTIKGAYDIMQSLYEEYMQNGKINPVSGIFLGKNNFGYSDKSEIVINQGENEQVSPKEIAEKYADVVETDDYEVK